VQDSDLRGDITFGSGCIVHARATIIAASGSIIFGEDCVIEENAVILNRRKEIMRIGKENHFMVGCSEHLSSLDIKDTKLMSKE
jgi:dynactin-6